MRDYAAAERRSRAIEDALHGTSNDAIEAERRARFAGVVRIERGPAAYRITFPQLSAHERGTDEARQAWDLAREPMADVKAIPGRTFDKLAAAWIVPAVESASVELLAATYGATIEQASDDAAAHRIAELEAQIAELTAELERAYAHDCRAFVGEAVAA